MCYANIIPSSSSKYSDSEYINGLKNNNQRIVNEFFYNHCRYMLNDLCKSMLKGFYDYDDMVSELYLYLADNKWRRLDTFNGTNGCSLKSWMVRVSWNYFNRRRQELLGKGIVDDDLGEIKTLMDGSDETVRAEIRIDVQNTLDAMPNKQYATVLRLLLIEDYDPEEVAEIVGTNTKNVYNLKHRAIVQFIKVFNGE